MIYKMNRKEYLTITVLKTPPAHFLLQSVTFEYKKCGV